VFVLALWKVAGEYKRVQEEYYISK